MLFSEYQLRQTNTLKNRLVMAPMTRCFADDDLVPTDEMATYYAKRADAGLIITEATIISPQGQGYPNTPGIFTEDQINGWKKTTQAVHDKGGKIFLQIWHTGRVSHSIYHDSKAPVAPSAVKLEGRVARTDDLHYEMPRALTTEEVENTVDDYKQAALNAIEAGFDGVEIHAANGYLIDQFLHQETNLRDDQYGGNVENRARFAIEVTEAVIDAIGADKTGIRLSPAAYFNLTHVENDEDTFIHLFKHLNTLNLAYVHVGMFDDMQTYNAFDGRVSSFIRKHYNGPLIGCGSYTIEDASQEIKSQDIDLVAIGRPFIANPDLVEKVKNSPPLKAYSEALLTSLV